MGTSIELCIGNVSLSYSKNHMGIDYGFLFQEGDLFDRNMDPIAYGSYEEHPEEMGELDEAEELFARTLSRILPRLEILGFTLEAARAEYQAVVAEAVELDSYSELEEKKYEYLSFEEFCNLACRYPLSDLKSGYIEYETPDRDMLSQGRFAADIDEFDRIPWTDNSDSYWSETSFLSARVCILSAESMLRVFALNAANAEVEVTWAFGSIVHAGWVQREAFLPGAQQKQKVLIATEGVSDARIIRRSLDILRPDVADFFNFVDVNERHHFWGTGNLVKFAEGLLRIDVLNQVLFVFDNDAEGVDAYRKLEKLTLPGNMRAMLLPDLEDFREFATLGPEGVSVSDINGRAAAIECYLDLRLDQYPPPQVTWSNFKKDIGAWHGVLDYKDSYSKHFYDQSDDLLRNGSYDVSKLLKLNDALIEQAGLLTP
ncbi:MAG: HEPN/Toprim-associated domain-containing protein [Acidithiobacillus sp.]|nr:HEPN/Toprim-associated domain-containing protein [Acidithiobacillus sp.]